MNGGDLVIDGHELGAFFGPEGSKYALCECDARFDGLTNHELVDAYEQHLGALATQPGLQKARRALAETLTRGKPMPPTTELETTR